mmetsp:Transcript_20829/g.32638  ORF Transcript_20829/g.32638 Transcript_20829/m.32638 type:complete len:291 (-) Transcript_20829:1385-2257(-)
MSTASLLSCGSHLLDLSDIGLEVVLHVLQVAHKDLEALRLGTHLLYASSDLLNTVVPTPLLQSAADELNGRANILSRSPTLFLSKFALALLLVLKTKLPASQPLVHAIHAHQLIMSSPLYNASILDHDDLIRIDDGRQTMGDHNGSTPNHQPVKGLLHQFLILGVQSRGSLVEQQDLRILKHGTGDSDTLPLTSGKHNTTLTNLGLVGIRDPHDEIVSIGHLGGTLYTGHGGTLGTVHDVLLNGHSKQDRLLRHKADLHPEPLRVIRADVNSVNQDPALVDIVETGDESN